MEKKNIYFFCGEDTYSSFQKSQFWKKEFEKKYGDYNVQVFENDLNANEIIMAAQSVPFLSEKKFILIQNFLRDAKDTEQKIMAEALEQIPDSCIVVFVETEKPDARTTLFKTLKKTAQLQEFAAPVGPQLIAWIEKEMTAKKAKIGSKEAKLLAETVGPNLWQMSQEVDKLALFSGGAPVKAEDIENLVSPNLSTSIFKLTDALAEKNPKNALKILKILLDSGEDLIKIMFMIARHFRILIQIRACLDQKLDKAQINKKIKEHPYVIMTATGQAKNFELKTLAKIHQQLLKIDSDIKSGKVKTSTADNSELKLAVQKFIIGLCR